MSEQSIKKIVRFSEEIADNQQINESKIPNIIQLINESKNNLNVYKGIIGIQHFLRHQKIIDKNFAKIVTDATFRECIALLQDNNVSPTKVGGIFLGILTIPNNKKTQREILMGCFYGALWPLMCDPNKLELATSYGVAIIKAAFSLDNFDIKHKIKIGDKETKIVCLAGSGKKSKKLLNISSMAAVITAAAGKIINRDIIVEKTTSKATSSITGSGDIFENLGINLNMSVSEMANISLKTKLGIFDINKLVPKLNKIYDGRLHNVQVFAGLVGGAAITNPVDVNLINYGLTRGSTKLCSLILNKLYPDKNIIVIQGKDQKNKPIIDQLSISSNTEISLISNCQKNNINLTPENFGFQLKTFHDIETTSNPKENLRKFIELVNGCGSNDLKQVVSMEVALNLYGLGIINDLKIGANIAMKTIHTKQGIEVIKKLSGYSKGNSNKVNHLLRLG